MRRSDAARAVSRIEVPGARDDRLFFAQVREDPLLELEAFAGHLDGALAVVSSGGCTALSLVAAGAGQVIGVDLNRTQNHIVDLKAAVTATAGPDQALAFLGGTPAAPAERTETYRACRGALTPGARLYWDAHPEAITRGVLNAGVSERLIGSIAWMIRRLAHPRARVERFLRCGTLDEQRQFYDREWDSVRWRLLHHLMANRVVLRKVYDPAFFQHIENPSFARHFLRLAEHVLTELPVRDNYFFHHIYLGYYRSGLGGGTPPYLAPENAAAMSAAAGRLTLVDGPLLAYLRSCPEGSLAGFSLSNICEWLTPGETDDLLGEIVRTARPGARLCFRNFVGWTEVPGRWRDVVREDRALGEALIARDRSMMQHRIAVCDIEK